jgi:hypothetical protein
MAFLLASLARDAPIAGAACGPERSLQWHALQLGSL